MVKLFFLNTFFSRTLTPLYTSPTTQTYFGVVLFIFLAMILCSVLATIAYVLSLSPLQDSEKRSEYECGFEPFDNATRLPFDVHFYLVGILFLIFDVEVALFFPWILSLHVSGWFGFYLIISFVLLLAVGFFYEWKRGALIWPSRQTKFFYSSTNEKIPLVASSIIIKIAETTSSANLYAFQLIGEIVFIGGLLLLLTLAAYKLGRGVDKKWLTIFLINAIQRLILLTVAIYTLNILLVTFPGVVNNFVVISPYVLSIKILTGLSCWFILRYSELFICEQKRHRLEYPIIFSLATIFMLLLIGTINLVAAFVAIVGFSLNLYVLILTDANSTVAREAGAKYFYLSTLSSGLILYGIFLFFLVTNTVQFFDLNFCISITSLNTVSEAALKVAVLLLLSGLAFKLSAVPGHLWAADVYEGSPDPITGFLMLPVKISVLAFTLQLLVTALAPLQLLWQPLIAGSAAASLVWGCFAALAERRTKRFLAFASINQIGFILTGLATASFEGYQATIFYLLIYAIINAGFLLIFLTTRYGKGIKRLVYLTDFKTLGTNFQRYSWSLSVILFSIAGIPPLAGFFSKYYILLHAQEQGLYGLVIIGLLTSLISTYYYLRLIKIIWFEKSEAPEQGFSTLVTSRTGHYKLIIIEWALWGAILYSGVTLFGIDALLTTVFVP